MKLLNSRIYDYLVDYVELLFPHVPNMADHSGKTCVTEFVKEKARGNISLQRGKYQTAESVKLRKANLARYPF
ncbi:MAG: hypothetical protein ACYC2R_06200 [Burkholderiales bacterium]